MLSPMPGIRARNLSRGVYPDGHAVLPSYTINDIPYRYEIYAILMCFVYSVRAYLFHGDVLDSSTSPEKECQEKAGYQNPQKISKYFIRFHVG